MVTQGLFCQVFHINMYVTNLPSENKQDTHAHTPVCLIHIRVMPKVSGIEYACRLPWQPAC